MFAHFHCAMACSNGVAVSVRQNEIPLLMVFNWYFNITRAPLICRLPQTVEYPLTR